MDFSNPENKLAFRSSLWMETESSPEGVRSDETPNSGGQVAKRAGCESVLELP